MISSIFDFWQKTYFRVNILPHFDQFAPTKQIDHHC